MLTLYFHPLSSFCHKVLIALYENGTPFVPQIVDPTDEAARNELLALWPVGKIPVLRDDRLDRTLPETSIIIEHLDRRYPGAHPLLPKDADERLEARLWDRVYDLYVHAPMQRIVADHLRPAGEQDPRGVTEAKAALDLAYGMIERRMAARSWAAGEDFGMADCAAAPALFYAGILVPFPKTHAALAAYFERLLARPSFARVLEEARPYFHLFPFKELVPPRFLGAAPG
jgi:glutathione S-transferase